VSTAAERGRSRPNLILAVLALGSLVYALLQSLLPPALPTIQRAVDTSESGVTWLLTTYLLSAAVATPILGRLGDIHGKRRILIFVFAAICVGLVVSAVATSLALMVLGRAIQGLGGGVFPLAFGIIRDEFPRERVAGSIGLVSSLLGLGGAVGVVLAGVIVDTLGYHWLFWMPLAVALIALAATIAFIPESPIRAAATINWWSAALMTAGLVAVLVAVSMTSTWGWGSPKTLGLIAVGLVILAAWVSAELRADSPLVDMRLMGLRGVWTTNLVAVLIGAGMFTGFVLIPQFVQSPPSAGFGFGSSVTAAGLFLVPMSLVMLIAGTLAGRVERRFGSKAALNAGSVFTLAGFVVLLVAHGEKLPIHAASALLGAGIGLAFSALPNLIVQSVPQDQTGVATGMNTVARSLGAAFGGQLAATFVANSVIDGLPTAAGFNRAFVMAIIALVAALGVGAAIPRRSVRQADSRLLAA
jgi:MFS family permease